MVSSLRFITKILHFNDVTENRVTERMSLFIRQGSKKSDKQGVISEALC